jgi:hypothetical protein
MNPFQFSSDDTSLPYANSAGAQWFPTSRKLKWPEDYRSCMGWVFALTSLASLVNIVRAILHPHSRTLLQNMLVGPIFYTATIAMAGIALWAVWKDKTWARHWAAVASAIYSVEFLRQFVIPLRPTWDHHLASLIIAVAGVLAFSWRDKQADAAAHFDRTKP